MKRKYRTSEEIFTTEEMERVQSAVLSDMPTFHDKPMMRKKKRTFRLKQFGIQTLCKACVFRCAVLQYNGEFVCFKFIRTED